MNEPKDYLMELLTKMLGPENPNRERFIAIGEHTRHILDHGTLEELQFLHGLLDGALSILPERVGKKMKEQSNG